MSTTRRLVVAAIAAAAVLGAVLVGLGLAGVGSGSGAPVAPAAAAGTVGAPSPVGTTAPGSAAGPTAAKVPPLPASPPSTITAPTIGVRSPVNPVGLNPDGTLQVPAPGPLYDEAAWYRGSVTPGEVGPSVILGHIDSARDGPSVFFRLAELTPRTEFTVTRADGRTLTFMVDGVRTYPKDAFPTEAVYGPAIRPELRLITCGGPFDRSVRSYRDNTVVFAHLVAATS